MVPAVTHERSVRLAYRPGLGLLVLNVLTFYSATWNGQPLILPIPSVIGKLITQGALPAALLVALTVNRRLVIRPNVFLCLVSLLVVEALLTLIRHEYLETMFGTMFRAVRLAGFVATLWLLTPWWGRRDLLLVRCHHRGDGRGARLGAARPARGSRARPERGQARRASWPTPPTQVAALRGRDGRAGGSALALRPGQRAGRPAVSWLSPWLILLLTHTRTALLAMVVGLLVGWPEPVRRPSPGAEAVRWPLAVVGRDRRRSRCPAW